MSRVYALNVLFGLNVASSSECVGQNVIALTQWTALVPTATLLLIQCSMAPKLGWILDGCGNALLLISRYSIVISIVHLLNLIQHLVGLLDVLNV